MLDLMLVLHALHYVYMRLCLTVGRAVDYVLKVTYLPTLMPAPMGPTGEGRWYGPDQGLTPRPYPEPYLRPPLSQGSRMREVTYVGRRRAYPPVPRPAAQMPPLRPVEGALGPDPGLSHWYCSLGMSSGKDIRALTGGMGLRHGMGSPLRSPQWAGNMVTLSTRGLCHAASQALGRA